MNEFNYTTPTNLSLHFSGMYPNWRPVTLNVACQLQKAKKTEDASRQPFAVLKFL